MLSGVFAFATLARADEPTRYEPTGFPGQADAPVMADADLAADAPVRADDEKPVAVPAAQPVDPAKPQFEEPFIEWEKNDQLFPKNEGAIEFEAAPNTVTAPPAAAPAQITSAQ